MSNLSRCFGSGQTSEQTLRRSEEDDWVNVTGKSKGKGKKRILVQIPCLTRWLAPLLAGVALRLVALAILGQAPSPLPRTISEEPDDLGTIEAPSPSFFQHAHKIEHFESSLGRFALELENGGLTLLFAPQHFRLSLWKEKGDLVNNRFEVFSIGSVGIYEPLECLGFHTHSNCLPVSCLDCVQKLLQNLAGLAASSPQVLAYRWVNYGCIELDIKFVAISAECRCRFCAAHTCCNSIGGVG